MGIKGAVARTKSKEERTPSVFGQTLRRERGERGLAVRELARRSGVSPAVISQIEHGDIDSPNWQTAMRLEAGLGEPRVHLRALVDGGTLGSLDEAIKVFAASELAKTMGVTEEEAQRLSGDISRMFLGFVEPLTLLAMVETYRIEMPPTLDSSTVLALRERFQALAQANQAEVREAVLAAAEAIEAAALFRSKPLLVKRLREIADALQGSP